MATGTYISIITLNVNGLNAPTKRHTLAEWIKKQDLYICCLQKTHFRPKDTYILKVRGWKNIVHANRKQKKAGVAIHILDKIDLKIKYITRDKEGHYIMIKGSIQEEDITIVNVYAPNMLLLSRFSHVGLCATPETAAHQAPPSLGFSRQKHWSGLPFPSPMHESEKWKWSRSVASDS